MVNGEKIAQAIQLIIEIDSAHQELDLAIGRVNTITGRIDDKMEHLAEYLIDSGLDDWLVYGKAAYYIEDGKAYRSNHDPELDAPADDQSDCTSCF